MGVGGDPRAASRVSCAANPAISGAAAGRRADAACGGPGHRSSALCGATDAPRAGDADSRREGARRRP